LLQQQFIRYTSNLMSIPSMKGCEWTQREIQNHLYKKIIFLNSRPPAFFVIMTVLPIHLRKGVVGQNTRGGGVLPSSAVMQSGRSTTEL